jgi:D-amino peptidase
VPTSRGGSKKRCARHEQTAYNVAVKPTIGFIGLGLMGRPMAHNVLKAGFPLIVHSRSAPPVDELVAAGARRAESPAGIARHATRIITMLPDTPDVERVLEGADGVFGAVQPGTILIDCSSISPAAAVRLATLAREAGAEMLDAPVSGGEIGAISGTLSIMCGGDAQAFDAVKPILDAMGNPERVIPVGDSGAGQITKVCNQIVIGGARGGQRSLHAGDQGRPRQGRHGLFGARHGPLRVGGHRPRDAPRVRPQVDPLKATPMQRMHLTTLLIAVMLLPLGSAGAQPGKKVFISADMEGISGISGSDQLSAAGSEYNRSRKMMADDVNAAIRGARRGGATEIVVNDSHGSMRNLRLEDLEPDVHLISHSFKKSGMMEGLDESFGAALFIGYHAKAGHPTGVFAHTGSGVVRDVRVNGQSLGEGGLNTMVAAWYGVPVVLVTGDDIAVAQVAEVATGAKTVAVKRAINPRAVELRPFRVVHQEIEDAAFAGVRGATRITPQRAASYRVEVQFQDVAIPEVAANLPTMERPAPDTIAFTSDAMPRAYTLIRLLYRYINPD